MERKETDKHSRELLFEFIKYGVSIFVWVCFLIYQITQIASNPIRYNGAVWSTIFSFVVLIILIGMAGVGLYRRSTSYIRWYQGILDSIPVPVIAIDKDARWLQANESACKAVNIEQVKNTEELNSRHLIGADGNVLKKTWMQGTTEYRVAGSRLCVGDEDVGHVMLFYNMTELMDSNRTRADLINEINRLLAKLSVASESFDGYATSLAGCTVQQAGIICELSDVIVGIASGTLNEPDALNEKMGIVKAHMQRQVESSQIQIDNIRKTVGDIETTRDSVSGVLRDIDRIP